MSIQDLPEEICDMTCDSLNGRDLKALGRTCRQWRTPAAKSLFRCISVEFNPGGCAAIANISKAKHLATAVRVVELRRTEFLPRFINLDSWEENAEYVLKSPWRYQDPSGRDWRRRGRKGRFRLLKEYKRELEQHRHVAAQLSTAVRQFLRHGLADTDWVSTEVDLTVFEFAKAIPSLPNVKSFSHQPAFDRYKTEWVWRGFRFDFSVPVLVDYLLDADIESLHLLAALCVFASSDVPALHRIDLSTNGPAFWGSGQTCRLLKTWHGKHADQSLDGMSHSTVYSESTTDTLGDGVELPGALSTLKLNISLTHLELHVNYDWHPAKMGLSVTALSGFLAQYRQLRNLKLTFGLHGCQLPVSKIAAKMKCDAASHIKSLSLSLRTDELQLKQLLQTFPSLEHLELQDVYLRQNEGMWETVLFWVGRIFRLKSICLEHLEDYLPSGEYRILFVRDASVCPDDSWLLPGTRQYESQLHACALGKPQILPSPRERFGYRCPALPF